ncbi:hypothetical protein CEXT_814911 [Caerostris extrusa]|uniref:Uncharacterized protein n=1 Tax=Caerostris extrusa TaxID=172846 RepID=A0AAV4VR57_CAEEX|nr:hypothetical protein CEXT_814911 [Caerostris extrusa]
MPNPLCEKILVGILLGIPWSNIQLLKKLAQSSSRRNEFGANNNEIGETENVVYLGRTPAVFESQIKLQLQLAAVTQRYRVLLLATNLSVRDSLLRRLPDWRRFNKGLSEYEAFHSVFAG